MADDGARRNLARDGLKMGAQMYIEVRNWLNRYYTARAHQKYDRGLPVESGEWKGAGPAMSRLLIWWQHLCDEDHERIWGDGTRLLERLNRLPPAYGKRPGRDDPVAIPRLTRSVFANPAAEPLVPGAGDAAGPPRVRPLGHADLTPRHENRPEAEPEPPPAWHDVPSREG